MIRTILSYWNLEVKVGNKVVDNWLGKKTVLSKRPREHRQQEAASVGSSTTSLHSSLYRRHMGRAAHPAMLLPALLTHRFRLQPRWSPQLGGCTLQQTGISHLARINWKKSTHPRPGWRRVEALPAQGVLWWNPSDSRWWTCRRKLAGYAVWGGRWTKNRVLFEALQEEILGLCGTDLWGLPKCFNSTKTAPWRIRGPGR